jgi:hypothetical protein
VTDYLAQVRWSDPDQLGHVNHARMAMMALSPTDERAFWQEHR